MLRGPVAWAVGLVLATAVGCSGADGGDDAPPAATVLAEAADTLEATSGVHLELSTEQLPEGVNGITGATGAVTDAPAFEGDLEVRLSGAALTVPVVAVDDTVWAELPFGAGWQDIDPADYGAPDPSRLIGADAGLVALLRATDDAQHGERSRGGEDNSEVLDSVTGTIPGEVVQRVIPSSATSEFDVTYLVTEEGELRSAELTGVFYEGSDAMTYVVTVSDYGLEQTITAP